METREKVALLPCPFCGGEARNAGYGEGHWITCSVCDAKGPLKWREKAEAIAAWNMRAAIPDHAEQARRIAELEKENAALRVEKTAQDAVVAVLREALQGLMAHEPDYSDTLWENARAALANGASQ